MTEDEMIGWHHQLNGHEFEQTPGDSEGQGRLACCSPWGCKESDTTKQVDDNNENTGDFSQSSVSQQQNWVSFKLSSVQFSNSVTSDSLQPHGL